MLTECPSCLTVFRVTGAILKMGHGQVRCGKCRTQFDALDSLLDDEAMPDAAVDAAQSTNPTASTSEPRAESQAESVIEARESDVGEEITLEGTRIEISGTYRVAADESNTDADDQLIHEHVVIDRDERVADNDQSAQEALEEQIIEFSLDDGEPVADAASHLLFDTAAASTNETSADEPMPLSQRMWKRARAANPLQRSAASQQIVDELDALTQTRAQAPVRSTWWTTTSVILLVALIAQVIHHYRDPLIRSPKWGGTIARLYQTLGLSFTPQWDLHAYELQQWGVIADSSARDALRVRASVTNTAPFAQPYPLVKLALEDRWGALVAMREFSPEEYLQSTANANRMMAPRQRANAEIVIVDPGADAVGFQIHACLPQGQSLVCSDDVPAK